MSSKTLRDELSNDPLARGYSTMTDSEVAADLKTEYRTRTVRGLSGGDVLDLADDAEFEALTAAGQQFWIYACQVQTIDPNARIVRVAEAIFGPGSTTVSNIQAAQTEAITRAAELGLGDVMAYDVAKAREQLG